MATPRSGAKITATNQDTMSAMATTAKSENVYSPAELAAKPTGHEAGDRHQRAGEHREGVGAECEGGSLHLVVALRQPGEHRIGRRHRVVDQQRERDDQRAERYALHVDPRQIHDREDDRQRQRNRSAMTRPGRTPRLMKHVARMMATACQSDVMNSEMALSTVTA